jgi:hypothetical protein
MKFDLKRPCPKCPFRTDCLPEWLGAERAAEIAQSITIHQGTFACHETTEAGGADRGKEQHCAGALIMLEHMGEPPPQNVRVAARLGMCDLDNLDLEAPVFTSSGAFIDHHSNDRFEQGEPCCIANAGCQAPAGFGTSYRGAVEAVVAADATVECAGCGQFVCEGCSEDTEDGRFCDHCREGWEDDE